MKRILSAFLLLALACTLAGCGNTNDHMELPEDFAFSIVWGTYGNSSYDSNTGMLVKTKHATDVSKYTCIVQLAEDQKAEVYRVLFFRY